METMNNMITDRLVNDYPFLEKRALVHFINDFGERRDHQSQQKKIASSGILTRVLDKVSGKSSLRQQAIDESTEDCLIFIKDYIVTNEGRWAENSVFLTEIAEGIGLLSGKLQQVDGVVEDIIMALSEVKGRVNNIEHQLDYQQTYITAQTEMDHALSVFALDNDALTPEQQLWFLLNELRYGRFGQWLASTDQVDHEQQVRTVLETLKNKCLKLLNQHTGRQSAELFDRSSLYASLSSKNQEVSEALCLVTNYGEGKNVKAERGIIEPLVYCLNIDGSLSESSDLPFIFSNNSLYDHMLQTLRGDKVYEIAN